MEQKIEIINNWNLTKFFNELENGSIKIPRFQRDYIWEKSKVVALLNSIYSQYPIGSIFLWLAPKEYKNYIRESRELGLPSETSSDKYQFILDGQQRITSLFITLKGKIYSGTDYRTIMFDMRKKEFLIPKATTKKNCVPAWKIIDPIAYGEVLADFAIKDREKNTNLASTWRELNETFTNYPLSIVRTLNSNLDDVVEIFERINQGGKRLTSYDLVQASTWSEDFDLSESILEFNSKGDIKKHGMLNDRIFTMSLTINIFENYNNALQLQLSAEQAKRNWKKTVSGINASIDFIKSMGISDDLTPYHNIIPVMQFYFYKSGKNSFDEKHVKDFEKWFWDAKFSNRYISASNTDIKEDINWILTLLD